MRKIPSSLLIEGNICRNARPLVEVVFIGKNGSKLSLDGKIKIRLICPKKMIDFIQLIYTVTDFIQFSFEI